MAVVETNHRGVRLAKYVLENHSHDIYFDLLGGQPYEKNQLIKMRCENGDIASVQVDMETGKCEIDGKPDFTALELYQRYLGKCYPLEVLSVVEHAPWFEPPPELQKEKAPGEGAKRETKPERASDKRFTNAGVEKFSKPVEPSPYFKPKSSREIASGTYKPMEWLWGTIIPEGFTLLSAPGKIGKSLLCQDMALHIAEGTSFLGLHTANGFVIYLDGEMSERAVHFRQKEMGFAEGVDNLYYNNVPGFQLDESGLLALDRHLENHPDTILVIIDTLEMLIPRSDHLRGMDAYQAGVARLKPIKEWGQKNGVSILAVHHTKKNPSSEGSESYDDASGSRGYTATADTLITFKRKSKDVFNMSVVCRHGVSGEYQVSRDNTVHWRLLDAEESKALRAEQMSEKESLVFECLKTAPWLGPTELSKLTGVSVGTIGNYLRDWCGRGLASTRPPKSGNKTKYAVKGFEFIESKESEDEPDF